MKDFTIDQKQRIAKAVWLMVTGKELPNLEEIINENPKSWKHLAGTLDLDNPNVFLIPKVGPVVSYNLILPPGVRKAYGWAKDSTLGLFTRGLYNFPTGDDIIERIISVSGSYRDAIENKLKRKGSIRDFHPNLIIEVYKPFIYICQYLLKQK